MSDKLAELISRGLSPKDRNKMSYGELSALAHDLAQALEYSVPYSQFDLANLAAADARAEASVLRRQRDIYERRDAAYTELAKIYLNASDAERWSQMTDKLRDLVEDADD